MVVGGQALISGDHMSEETASAQSGKPTTVALQSSSRANPQWRERRHRTRSDGLYDPALHSGLSSISTTNENLSSTMEHAAVLEGKFTVLGGTPVSPARHGVDSRHAASEAML